MYSNSKREKQAAQGRAFLRFFERFNPFVDKAEALMCKILDKTVFAVARLIGEITVPLGLFFLFGAFKSHSLLGAILCWLAFAVLWTAARFKAEE